MVIFKFLDNKGKELRCSNSLGKYCTICDGKVLLMSTHNICLHKDIIKISASMFKLKIVLYQELCLFVLRFYGPVNPMGSCRAGSIYLATRLLGRLSPLSG